MAQAGPATTPEPWLDGGLITVKGLLTRVETHEVQRQGGTLRKVLAVAITVFVFGIELALLAFIGPRVISNLLFTVGQVLWMWVGLLVFVVILFGRMFKSPNPAAMFAFDFIRDRSVLKVFRRLLRLLFPVRWVHGYLSDALGGGKGTEPLLTCVMELDAPPAVPSETTRVPGGLLSANPAGGPRRPGSAMSNGPPPTPAQGRPPVTARMRGEGWRGMVYQGQHVVFEGQWHGREKILSVRGGRDTMSGSALKSREA